MALNGVNLTINRQDDCNQMGQNLIKFANDYKNNPATAVGTNLFAIMGDGAPALLAGINNELKKLGDDYVAQIVFSCGKSQGEDAFMASPEIKANPQKARGAVCSAVLRDGDWNIVIKWCGDNGIPVNTDEKTYNPDAMNFVGCSGFLEAAEKYITGYSEERPVVKVDPQTGKTVKTGDKKRITVDCTTTWTPGDVNVVEKKGGLVRIVSTAEYRSQMPNVVIGVKKWLQDNRKTVENFILAVSAAGDQVKTYPEALNKAGELSAKVYNEGDANYWVKYYKGAKQIDNSNNNIVELGGSRVHNLSDNLELFGIGQSKTNVYASVYKKFGDVVSSLYPEYVATYPDISEVLDLSYLQGARNRATNITSADKIEYSNTSENKETIAKRVWKIEFETGSANFTPAAEQTLNQLFDELNIASGLQVEIFGHTDNTGSADVNRELSQARADAVKKWLQNKSYENYPNNRFVQVVGKGPSEPIADNNTSAGKAKNRRVEILMVK
jgi:outer membrane protein OmpA-like peptidoglycan-associated protein